MRVGVLVLFCAAFTVAGCKDLQPNVPGSENMTADAERANAQRLKRACGSTATYDRLKSLAFEQAVDIRKGNSAVLDALATNSILRMESPVAKSRDETLNVTVCSGHMILELPPGAADAFDGDRRLEADVEYSAQEAVDGSGLVYQIKGAEPIIYRLAALDLQSGGNPSPAQASAAAPGRPAEPTAQLEAPRPAPAPVTTLPPERPQPTPVAERPKPAPIQVQPTPARARPSFTCGGSRSRVERMICSSDNLAARDRAMSSQFYAALAGATGSTRSALRTSRDRFLRYRDRCADEACVAQAYSDRIDEIRDIAADR